MNLDLVISFEVSKDGSHKSTSNISAAQHLIDELAQNFVDEQGEMIDFREAKQLAIDFVCDEFANQVIDIFDGTSKCLYKSPEWRDI